MENMVRVRRPIRNGEDFVRWHSFEVGRAVWDQIEKTRKAKDPLNPLSPAWEEVELDKDFYEAEAKAKEEAEAEAAKLAAEAEAQKKADAKAAKEAEKKKAEGQS